MARRARCSRGGRPVARVDPVALHRRILRHLERSGRLPGDESEESSDIEPEAGLVTNFLGATFSVVSGGIGCLIATAWIAAKTPALRRYRREDPVPEAA